MKHKLLAALVALALPAVSSAAELTNFESERFKVRLGGFFQGAAHYDTNSAASRPWLITVPSESSRGAFTGDLYGTRINMGIESVLQESTVAKGFLEFDWGLVTQPRMRHAYVSLDIKDVAGILIGQYWIPNLPINADTFSPNFLLKQGNTWSRAPQVTLFRSFGPVKTALTLAPSTSVTGSVIKPATATHALTEQAMPAGFLQVAYYLNPKSFVSVVGGAGRALTTYTGTEGAAENTLTSYYGEIGANLAFGSFGLSGKAYYGVGGLLNSGAGQALVVDVENNVTGIPALGGMLSAKYAFTPKFNASLYAGLEDPDDQVDGVNVTIQRNLTFGGTLGYALVDNAILGLEVMNVSTTMTTPAGAEDCNDLRSSLVARYSF